MMRITSCLAMLLILLLASCGQRDASAVEYETYFNKKFRYEIKYPKGVLIPQGEATNGDGQVFQSKDKKAALRVYASYNISDVTLKESYENLQSAGDTYKKIDEAKRWFVISGIRGDTVYYVKKYLVDDVYFSVEIEYPKSEKKLYDPITEEITKSFKL